MKKYILIKTSVWGIGKLKKIIKKNGELLIISSTEYVQRRLYQDGIKSELLKKYSKFKKCRDLHGFMDKQYKNLCLNSSAGLDYADIFRNHLVWETQRAFYFISCFNELEKKHDIRKVYFEPFPLTKKIRLSKDINKLFINYCRRRGIAIEVL